MARILDGEFCVGVDEAWSGKVSYENEFAVGILVIETLSLILAGVDECFEVGEVEDAEAGISRGVTFMAASVFMVSGWTLYVKLQAYCSCRP